VQHTASIGAIGMNRPRILKNFRRRYRSSPRRDSGNNRRYTQK